MSGLLIRPSAVTVLGASAVAFSNGATTTEDIFATINVPAGAMGLSGILRVLTAWSVTNSANNKTLSVRLGGIGGTAYFSSTYTTIASCIDLHCIQNRGAANSQVSFVQSPSPAGGLGAGAGALKTGAVDTSVAQTVVITGQKGLAGETITLESYIVELILP
jgi:hypothetical protein